MRRFRGLRWFDVPLYLRVDVARIAFVGGKGWVVEWQPGAAWAAWLAGEDA